MTRCRATRAEAILRDLEAHIDEWGCICEMGDYFPALGHDCQSEAPRALVARHKSGSNE